MVRMNAGLRIGFAIAVALGMSANALGILISAKKCKSGACGGSSDQPCYPNGAACGFCVGSPVMDTCRNQPIEVCSGTGDPVQCGISATGSCNLGVCANSMISNHPCYQVPCDSSSAP